MTTIRITYDVMDYIGLTKEELHQIASKNTSSLLPPTFEPMNLMIRKLMQNSKERYKLGRDEEYRYKVDKYGEERYIRKGDKEKIYEEDRRIKEESNVKEPNVGASDIKSSDLEELNRVGMDSCEWSDHGHNCNQEAMNVGNNIKSENSRKQTINTEVEANTDLSYDKQSIKRIIYEEAYNMGCIDNTCSEDIYILSNAKGINGATSILYPKLLEYISRKMDSDLYILPSSIHEVIVLSVKKGYGKEELEIMVKEINHSEVDVEDILSEKVYIYSRENDCIHM